MSTISMGEFRRRLKRGVYDPWYPMNVLDQRVDNFSFDFKLPAEILKWSLGQAISAKLIPDDCSSRLLDFTTGISDYLLLSQKGCQTQFHVDFSATTIWYFLLFGKKTFYFVSPTDGNLVHFFEWRKDASKYVGLLFFL